MKKRIVSWLLCICMLAGMFPLILPEAAAADSAGTDAYGFVNTIPDTFDPNDGVNPYGQKAVTGKVNFNPVKELGIYESAANYRVSRSLQLDKKSNFSSLFPTKGYHNAADQLVNKFSGSDVVTQFSGNVNGRLQFPSGVAFDPDGTGRDDTIAYYGFHNASEGGYDPYEPIFSIGSAKEKSRYNEFYYWTVSSQDDNAYTWIGQVPYAHGDGYNAMVAGDFDGDGRDTLVVYDPALGKLTLREFAYYVPGSTTTGSTRETATIEIGKMGANHFGADLNTIQKSKGSTNLGQIRANSAMVNLHAANLDNDDEDELIVTISLPDLNGGEESALTCTSSVVMIMDKSGGSWKTIFSAQMADIYDSEKVNTSYGTTTGGWYMRSAGAAAGDIDGDGAVEIVVLGIPADDKRHNDDDVSRADLLFTVIENDGKGGYSVLKDKVNNKDVILGWFKRGDSTGQDYAVGLGSHAENSPRSIGCAHLDGLGTKPYVIAQGHIFQYGTNGFTPATVPGDSKTNYDRFLEDIFNLSQPVIGNFDGDVEGRDEVFFVSGQRNGAPWNKDTVYHWIVAIWNDPQYSVMSGEGIRVGEYETNVRDRYGSYNATVVITAPDIDTDDGMIGRYTGKQYAFADPEVMAILEAAPYFEDIADKYTDPGATSFGVSSGSGSGGSETSSVRAGAYVGFEQDFKVFGVTVASMEMEAAYEAEWSKEMSIETAYEYEMGFDGGSEIHQVVMVRTPVIVYSYEVWDTAGNSSTMTISQAQTPAYTMIPLEEYNAIAESMGATEIGKDIIPSTPGQPKTYRQTTAGLKDRNLVEYPNEASTGEGAAIQSQTITTQTSQTLTTSLEHSFDAKIGGGAGGFTVGVTAGYSGGSAKSVTNTSGITRGGAVSNIPTGYSSRYGFNWKFICWDAIIDGYKVPVLSYVIDPSSIRQAPSMPQNVNAVADSDSVTLTWEEGSSSVLKYEVYRYLEDGPGGQYYYYLDDVSKPSESGEYVFVHEGLKPNTRYQYCLRAVGRDGEKTIYSDYTEPLAVVTGGEGEGLPIISQQPKSISARPGSKVDFTVNAYVTDMQATLSYQWQSRKSGEIAWKNIEDATRATLSISSVDNSMSGNEYRCMVSSIGNANPVFIYSDSATLTVGRDDTKTILTVGSDIGQAEHPGVEYDEQDADKVYDIQISGVSEKEQQYYAYNIEGGGTVYQCISSGKYYLLTNLNANDPDPITGIAAGEADGRTELTVLEEYLLDGTGKIVAAVADLLPAAQKTEVINGVPYLVFRATGAALTTETESGIVPAEDVDADQLFNGLTDLTLYKKAGGSEETYYVDIHSGKYGSDGAALAPKLVEVTAAVPASEGQEAEITENMTYLAPVKEVVAEEAAETEDGYFVYTDGTATVYEQGGVYHTRTEKAEGEGYDYAALTQTDAGDVGKLAAITGGVVSGDKYDISKAALEQTKIQVARDVVKSGTAVKLTAKVDKIGGDIEFRIVNTATNVQENIRKGTTSLTAEVSWTPPAAGVYQITAVYLGNGALTNPSVSNTVTYYAYGAEESGYELTVADGTYGTAITATLNSWKNNNGNVEKTPVGGAAISALQFVGIGTAGADENGYIAVEGWTSGKTLLPGSYVIRAAFGEGNAIDKAITVDKKAVTVEAPQIGDEDGQLQAEAVGDLNLADYLGQIEANGVLSADKETYGTNWENLFTLNGIITSQAGFYDVTVGYVLTSAAADIREDFLSKYVPTFQKSTVEVVEDSYTVTYSAGLNGTLQAYVGSAISSGAAVLGGSNLTFVAEPAENFVVDQWTVNGREITEDHPLFASLSSDKKILSVNGLDEELEVEVTFTNKKAVLTYRAEDENGTLSAKADGVGVPSGTNLAGGSNLSFTAAPNPGFIVKEWKVNGEVRQNEDGSTFAGKELELSGIDGDVVVTVAFEKAVNYRVTYSAVDTDYVPLSAGVTLSAEGLTDDQAVKGSKVVISAVLNPGNAVQAWQISEDGGITWQDAAAAQASYTISNLQKDLQVRVVVNRNAVTYTVGFGVIDEDGFRVPIELKAAINGSEIKSDSSQPIGSRVQFTLSDTAAYEIVGWKNNGELTEVSYDELAFTLESLTDNVTVQAVVRRKPMVTVDPAVNGTVEVTYTFNGESVEPREGYVHTGTDVAVTLYPNMGYEVGEIAGQTPVYTDDDGSGTDNKRYTIENVQEDQTITPVFVPLATYPIVFSAVDTGSGANGEITAKAERKGMDIYKVDPFTTEAEAYAGSKITFTAAPDEGYRVSEWTVNDEVQETEGITYIGTTLTLDAISEETEVTVQFTELGDKITAEADANGKIISAMVGQTEQIKNITKGFTLNNGASVTFKAEPSAGYEVDYWEVNGTAQENTSQNEFTYTSAGTGAVIKVNFRQVEYPVSWRAENGSVTVANMTSEDQIRGGTALTFTASPDSGYVLESWKVNGETVGATSLDFVWTVPNGMAEEPQVTAYVIEAVYTRNTTQYTVTYRAEPTEGGTVSTEKGADGSVTATYGDTLTFTAAPKQYYYVSGWKVDGILQDGTANKESFALANITADTTVTACFAQAIRYDVQYKVVGAPAGGTLSATQNGEQLTLTGDQKGSVYGGSKLVFTAVPDTNYMVKEWKINGDIVEGNITNGLVIEALTQSVTVTVEFETYTGYEIPASGTGYKVSGVTRTPADTYAGAPENEIRRGGDVTFTVDLDTDYTTISELVINGYDCITGGLTGDKDQPDNCASVSAVKNADGSYTVTITGVSDVIQSKIVAHQLVIGGLVVPEVLAGNPDLDTVDEIQATLKISITGSKDNVAYYDIALKYKDGTGNWVTVSESNFPMNGVDVVLPYPDGTNSRDTFTVLHMLTTAENAGKVEVISGVKKYDDGLHFHVTSLSPFAVGYSKYAPPIGGGGGYGVTVEESLNGAVTADKEIAEKGDTVTVTVTPDEGYRLDKLTVTDKDGKEIEVTEKDGKYTFEMPASDVSVEAAFEKEIIVDMSKFTDLDKNAWYYPYVEYVVSNGLFYGTSGTTFSPNGEMTRAMLVTVLYRLENEPEVSGDLFDDVADGAYYADAVVWASQNEIVLGYGNGEFRPDDAITREQLAAMLYRYAQFKGYDTTARVDLSAFSDGESVSAYAKDAVNWAVGEGIINGKGNGILDPKGNATRAEVAAMLQRFLTGVKQ